MSSKEIPTSKIVSSVLKVRASEGLNIEEDLLKTDNNQKTIAELLHEQEKTTSDSGEETGEDQEGEEGES